ncbi:MAG: AraC family transcriptional regulator [Bacteroidetes bacterium]|nr:AraC family transcriptional regulator [Bacteroidota bacterium]
MNLSDILFIIVIFQLLFISVFLFTHEKGRRISNTFLAAFFLSIALNLADSFLVIKKVYLNNTALVAWSICLPLLFGPLLYLYTQSVLYKDFKFSRKKWVHFLPFIILGVSSEIRYLLLDRAMQVDLLNRIVERKIPAIMYWSSGLIFLQFFLYIAASFRLIRQYKKIASNEFSDQQRNNITWLSSTILFFTICMILAAFNGFTGLTSLAKYYFLLLTILVSLIFIFINSILLRALRQPEIFSIIVEKETSSAAVGPKYAGSALNEEDKKRILEQLRVYMENKKPYMEPELTLEQLATQLAIRPKILSQVINESLQQNFFDFINRYRIEEAKKLLTKPADKKITVLEVLYEVGFNSKSSFNTIFKKHTGLTPSEFKKKNSE